MAYFFNIERVMLEDDGIKAIDKSYEFNFSTTLHCMCIDQQIDKNS